MFIVEILEGRSIWSECPFKAPEQFIYKYLLYVRKCKTLLQLERILICCRCEIGLNGLVISSPDGYRVLRKYPLNHIARWALRGSVLVLYTKTPADVEEHTLTLQGDQRTITNILDTLTCSCMQWVQLLSDRLNIWCSNSCDPDMLESLKNCCGLGSSHLP